MAKRKITIEDLRSFKFVSDPQTSPNGEKIAFVLSTINPEEDTYERHIWMADVASGEVEQFTYGVGKDTYPRWSPDGGNLLFLSSGREPDENKPQVWIIPSSGGEAKRATDNREGVSKPMWAPDSRQILYLSKVWTEEKSDSDVKVIKRIKYKLNGVGTFEGRRTHLFTARFGREPKQLTEGEFDVETAKWSPNGKKIAYTANKEENADTSRVRDIFLISVKGGEPEKLTEGAHVVTDLSWSPDSRRIAFIGHDRPEDLAVNQDLWVMPSQGGEMENLTRGFDRSLNMGVGCDVRVSTPKPGAVWSSDGRDIYFLTASIPHSNIYKVNHTGDLVETVIGGKTIDGFSLSEDGSVIAYNAMDATHPAELYVEDSEGERRLTDFNDSWLKNVLLSVPEHFTFMNGLGEEIDGWIIKPYGYKKSEEYPCLLEIHGGPRGVYGDGMFHEFQVLAAEGYAVIYTNPRGSAGYDEDYAQAVMRHYSECDYEDLMLFTEAALKRFEFIDEARLGVLGGSYGGYMTNWIVGQTNRFAAAVSYRSICNWVSKFGVSDIGYMQPESIAGTKDYWDEMEEHLARSPLKYAKKVKTPILIIHSEKDLRCPMEQAEQWFVSLKLNGVETELVRFPDETHELSRSGGPKHREERLQHTLRWFNKYLR
ncbi:MAG: S9 family peptidase [Candidatus Bathyarchaeota archaeon]|jgi:dipeptidyl aminopeptidase/acylaminoacyl peptidase